MEKTFLMVKPDGVARGLIGEIISRFENKGYTLNRLEMLTPSVEIAEAHYAEHKEKPFFGELVDFLTSGPVVAMEWEGENIIAVSRMMIGKTNPLDAQPGTIRGDLAATMSQNVIHGSDIAESAERELALWFVSEASHVS
ncbi:nucleoside-diphosphate kinase [Exiguobacterium alkaliphilum]|uniref:nucleoside-diphosphate kinase n=1 Tax=Exiguobacterium alkaliphilum TaxID=1428684 RepID=UPI001BAC3B8F|nr:nucleoside-diphosphate kinase [Exiguobacterium alkaliphilum]QUE85577.1 nucleoside-diphosphate kinase [Exiguobacterium alkaliphilum]